MKRSIILFSIILFSTFSGAQVISTEIRAGYINLLGAKVNAYGIGGGLMRHFNEKCGLSFDALLYFGGKQETTMTADANNSFITPSTFEVPVTRKFILYSGAFSFRYYLMGDCEDEQGLYGYIGIGATKGRVKNTSVGPYDNTSYHLDNGSEGNVDGLEGFTANIGLTYEKLLGRVYFLADVKYHYLVLDNTGSSSTGFILPSSLTIDAGFRFPVF